MSYQLQRNIRQNVSDMKEYIGDLYKWTKDVEEGKAMKQRTKKTTEVPIRGRIEQDGSEEQAVSPPTSYKVDKSLLRKDKVPLVDYYKAWDKVDVEEELKQAEQNNSRNVVQEAFDANLGKEKSKNVGLQIKGGRRPGITALEDLKSEGNELFRQREYVKAIDKYTECMVTLSNARTGWTLNKKASTRT